jgi:O-antigen/teichoic acid export membrane protein
MSGGAMEFRGTDHGVTRGGSPAVERDDGGARSSWSFFERVERAIYKVRSPCGETKDAARGKPEMTEAAAAPPSRDLPPVLGRLLGGSLLLALRVPLQTVLALWSVPLILRSLGEDLNGAYVFAWSFGFLQSLLEFGMSSSLQRQISEAWTKGDREGVDRGVACGMNFYAVVSIVQAAVLLAIAHGALPNSGYVGKSYNLILKLLWLQVFTAPFYGLSMVVSSVLQAARRYDFIPRLEVFIVVSRFVILVTGLRLGVDFFLIVAAQTVVQIGMALIPSIYVMTRDLGFRPHFRGARRSDYASLLRTSFYMFLLQLSVVLATSVDTTILFFALPDPGRATTIYNNVSKAFVHIRQTGWTLAYLVLPAVASLVAARDHEGLDRVKYDGPRLHAGVLLPIALLAWLYAEPFLWLWVGKEYASWAYLMRLFLVASLPLWIAVQVQAVIGMGKVEVVALLSLAGSLVNLPLSYFLTRKIGVAGVIWGTVLTTLFANWLAPGVYVFRILNINLRTYFFRTLAAPLAGAFALVPASWATGRFLSPEPHAGGTIARVGPLLVHLCVGCAAYLIGYACVAAGREDLVKLARRLRRFRFVSTPIVPADEVST